ncbi:MAG TPA: ABC transporter permease, partial [Candidatus Angelobacter sp.]|nr:ABC transporter permease [Candidatus Angelobacter sp.]
MASNGSVLTGQFISPGDWIKHKVVAVQDYAVLAWLSVINLFRRPIYIADMIQQADLIGVGSLPIVAAAIFFTGAALALNSATTLTRFGALSELGQLVSIGIVRELGPVLAGLVVSGRNAAGIASELGSMTVTEQIDAMRALGTDPSKKLVTPRVVATTLMLFFLTIVGDLMGLVGGNFVSSSLLGVDSRQYWHKVRDVLEFADVFIGLTKPLIFGFIIATVGCYFGLSTR